MCIWICSWKSVLYLVLMLLLGFYCGCVYLCWYYEILLGAVGLAIVVGCLWCDSLCLYFVDDCYVL